MIMFIHRISHFIYCHGTENTWDPTKLEEDESWNLKTLCCDLEMCQRKTSAQGWGLTGTWWCGYLWWSGCSASYQTSIQLSLWLRHSGRWQAAWNMMLLVIWNIALMEILSSCETLSLQESWVGFTWLLFKHEFCRYKCRHTGLSETAVHWLVITTSAPEQPLPPDGKS